MKIKISEWTKRITVRASNIFPSCIKMLPCFFFALFVAYPAICSAMTITECGESKGNRFNIVGGLISKKDYGWQDDGISNGRIILNKVGEKYSLFTKSHAGFMDVTQDGGELFVVQSEPNLLIIVIYSKAVETYLFNLDSYGSGEVVWTSTKNSALISSSAIFNAKCSPS